LLCFTTLTACQSNQNVEKAAIPAVPVKVRELQSGIVEDSSEFVGTLEAKKRVDLKSEIQGRITQVLVQPGEQVKRGKPILVLAPDQTVPQFESAQASVGVAQSNRNALTEQLRVAEKNLEVAQTNLASARASRDLAKTNQDRASFLLSQGAIGQFDHDRAKTDLEIKTNQLSAAQKQIESAQALVRQAGAVVRQSDASIRQAQAQAAAAAVNVNFKQVLAPISGIVGDLPHKVGDYLSGGQTVTSLVQNDVLDLRLSVPSSRINQLRLGLPVKLLDPATQDPVGSGALSFISPTVDTIAQVVLVKARFPNASGRLRNGQYTEARIIWERKPGVLIPTSAVLQVSGKSFVYVAEANAAQGETQQIARMRPVQLGAIQGQQYNVIDGLKVGEQLVVSGILRLRDGVPIQPES
jgi:RND family efflux transporter MFP subunit